MLKLPDLHIADNTQLVPSAAVCLLVVGIIARAFLAKSESGLPLPPSPPTWRLKGHFLPQYFPSLTIAGWIEKYGPVVTIRSGFERVVLIGRYKAAVDIMENQGKFTADRPRNIAGGEIFNGGMSIVFSPLGDRFRRMRRALHSHLQPKAAEVYQPLQMSHASNTVLGILDDPHNFQNHVTTYAATTIMKVAYGKTAPTSATDPDVVALRRRIRFSQRAMILYPGAYLVNAIPWLKYLPWYARDLKQEFEKEKKHNIGRLNLVKEKMQKDVDIGPSFMRYMLENDHIYGLTETEMAFLSGTFFAAGSSTTFLAICAVLLAAARFPEEQAKVQAELDAVIGRRQAPTFADQESLPRLQAFISEALRWRPPVPNGALAHRTTHDVVWENYCIPAGTTLHADLWSISRDPDVYPEPEEFKPQRWIDDQGRLSDDLKFFVYGFGRRVCPGQHVANRSVFINSLLILWAFRLTLDPTKPLNDIGFMLGAVSDTPPCPIEFETRIPESELRRLMQHYP
ncbi:cytochrome P450 [Suillus fuscotomentosus]|uniref:Cytochrome P450 n=1 Tax=Suillus fuscotomentosus TaxID=1912939 RepID=A0AAD4EEE0_9AGAM|nr:cytochrome P450 [Suillus fuscotomentosus]KAG1904597.1 cytochrome P450 [Suillus fuscotomentosus]